MLEPRVQLTTRTARRATGAGFDGKYRASTNQETRGTARKRAVLSFCGEGEEGERHAGEGRGVAAPALVAHIVEDVRQSRPQFIAAASPFVGPRGKRVWFSPLEPAAMRHRFVRGKRLRAGPWFLRRNVMKKFVVVFGLALSGLLAGGAQAQTVTDTDGNGVYSIEELKAAYPAVDAAKFAEIDQNGDGSVDADELQAAIEAGKL